MLRSTSFPQRCAQPIARQGSIGHGFLRGEGFGGHQHQRARGIEPRLHLRPGMAIHIRQIMPAQRCLIGPERARHHGRAEIRPANADIQHIGEAFTLGGKNAPFMYRTREFLHARAHRKHFGHDIFSAGTELIFRRGAECHMQRGAAFRGIHCRTCEKPRAEARDITRFGECQQSRKHLIRQRGFGKVEQDIAGLVRKPCETIWIGREKRANFRGIRPCRQSHQRRPGGLRFILCHEWVLARLRGGTMAEGGAL